MLKKLWRFISRIGIQDHYDDKLVKRITLTNQFNFIAIFIVTLSGLQNILLDDLASGLMLESIGLICISGYFMNAAHHHKFATSFLMFTICSALFYFDSYAGTDSGTYLFYFLVILGIPFVFDFQTEKITMAVHTIIAFTYIVINVVTHHKLFENTAISMEDRYQMFVFNIIFSAITVAFFMYVFVSSSLREHHLYEQRINERKLAEQTIQQALHEKEILLAELHHRVKNNMAIISSLFSFSIDTTLNEEAKVVLLESKNRIQSMALIHNKLYKSPDLSQVNFKDYVGELLNEISSSYPHMSKTVVIEKEISNIQLNVNKAVPCGLILNELLTNCYKHAFKNKESGAIEIKLSPENENLKLFVKDNGVGLNSGYENKDSIGVSVIQALSEQLNGTYSYNNNNGTEFTLRFPN